ncbi:uncharacterized protein LOC122346028 isoform X2 [Puntigrus tetrazona]|uniref:uncharacterized protein LOC122346028 isoform X2 n=1 Tax=Puntigrus tetrazona TaxID=1606681 RepID=UPI001C8AD3D7|nr:uncharacterized protein LOC122346028 isoform X2 [Puntigrus tetrazona]
MFVSMRALFIFVVFQYIREARFQSCIYTETDYVCKEIPKDYPADLTSMIIFVSGLGDISLSMFNSTNLTSVNSLTMAHQGITAIGPQTFDMFKNLKTLNLDNNRLSQVSSNWFSHHVTLEALRLSNNKITRLDYSSLVGLSNLLNLDLSQNQVHTITPRSFLGFSKLRQLNLSNNKLTHLSMDVFLPLNGTKICLDGNPWDCSCSVNDFAKYLRGLQNASLLENDMLVCCNSPPDLKGVPLWQVPECKTLTSMSPTTMSLTTGSPGTGNPATVLITKPLTIGQSTSIIFIVVLCALVLVVCVLSALYHRKRERKHLQAVKPVSEKSEMIRNSESAANSNEEHTQIKSNIANKTQIATTGVLLRTDQMVVGDEKISQIYHIYSSGTYDTRESIKRVRSAGPVLCQMEMFSKPAEVATDEVGVSNDEYYNGWITSEKTKDNVCVNFEKLEDGRNFADEEIEGSSEVSNTSDTLESHKDLKEKIEDTDESVRASTSVNEEAVQHGVENNVLDHLNELAIGAESSQDVLQITHVTSQTEETDENLPYLTIGAGPENQTSGVDQNTIKETSGPSRPFRRVLTWPPTAAQWKKQWAQNQQVLNVFPQLIFVAACRHDIRPYPPSISPAIFPTAPQFTALEFLPEITSPMEDVRITIDEDNYRASLESSNQRVLHFSAKECFSNTNIPPREDGRIITNGETWMSGLESNVFSDLPSKNSAIDESEVCSELFSIFNPSFDGSKSKSGFGEEINNQDDIDKMLSMKTKVNRFHQREQVELELQKQSRRAGKAAERAQRDRRQGQMCEGSDSRAPPAGGSPKDDSLLLGNEYTFIDLLHEVTENHGRWTRDRWRQTQKNKQKLKQSR